MHPTELPGPASLVVKNIYNYFALQNANMVFEQEPEEPFLKLFNFGQFYSRCRVPTLVANHVSFEYNNNWTVCL